MIATTESIFISIREAKRMVSIARGYVRNAAVAYSAVGNRTIADEMRMAGAQLEAIHERLGVLSAQTRKADK